MCRLQHLRPLPKMSSSHLDFWDYIILYIYIYAHILARIVIFICTEVFWTNFAQLNNTSNRHLACKNHVFLLSRSRSNFDFKGNELWIKDNMVIGTHLLFVHFIFSHFSSLNVTALKSKLRFKALSEGNSRKCVFV